MMADREPIHVTFIAERKVEKELPVAEKSSIGMMLNKYMELLYLY